MIFCKTHKSDVWQTKNTSSNPRRGMTLLFCLKRFTHAWMLKRIKLLWYQAACYWRQLSGYILLGELKEEFKVSLRTRQRYNNNKQDIGGDLSACVLNLKVV